MTFDFVGHERVLLGATLALFALLAWLALSAYMHRKSLSATPIRIHVGGSRGKTSTARLIGAGLRAGGFKVLAKTTGTSALLILPDGSEERWRRRGPASIAEQIRFFRRAARLKVDAVVLESMAIEPEYLWALERYLVRATHVAITNVRPDHAEALGHDPNAMAQATSLLMPENGAVFLTHEAAGKPLLHRASALGNTITTVDVNGLEPSEANRQLAGAVCHALGVEQMVADAGFDQAGTDPGGFGIYELDVDSRPIRFYNAFACNDVQSFQQLWHLHNAGDQPTVLLSGRADRPDRTRDFIQALSKLKPEIRLVLAGNWSSRWIRKSGMSHENVFRLRARAPADVLAELAALSGGSQIWGVGNYSGLGQALSEHLKHKGLAC